MKKKNLAIVAIFFVTSVASAFAQFGVSIANSFCMEKAELFTLKNKMGQTVNLYYYFSSEQGLSLQFRNSELWKIGSGPQNFINEKTMHFQYFLYGNTETGPKCFFAHKVGISVALGTPFNKKNEDPHILKCSLFSGVFIEFSVGKRISKKLVLNLSVKSEGIYGLIRDGSDGGLAGGANGFVSVSAGVLFNKLKDQNVYLDPF